MRGRADRPALECDLAAGHRTCFTFGDLRALAIAARPDGEDERVLFRRMLLWGLSMTVVGALFCQFFIRFFAT